MKKNNKKNNKKNIIQRYLVKAVLRGLKRQSCVAIIGPRQCGKTTLARMLVAKKSAVYLDLELLSDRDKLKDPEFFLRQQNHLVVLDEIHRMPEIFQTLRSIIDMARWEGKHNGRFLVLGSAAIDLLKQSGETLAGRIEYINFGPLNLLEVKIKLIDTLWVRGGFPDSFLAKSDEDSYVLRRSFIRTYLERDVPQFGPRIPAEILERLWIMLAYQQGALLNVSRLASGILTSSPTVENYIGLLVDLLLVRRLPPFYTNIGKRLVKSPKIYIRDSGILHALLAIKNIDELYNNPIIGSSWEGFVIENILAVAKEYIRASFYRTIAGAEIDLVLEIGGVHGIWAIEIKRGISPVPSKGFYNALNDIKPSKSFVVYSGTERYFLHENVEVIGLKDMMLEVEKL